MSKRQFSATMLVSTKEFKLSDARMEVVVLEWLNHGCPFVRKHYDSGNMQKLQTAWGAKTEKTKNKSAATDILLDPEGKVGMLYGAKATPHMFVINKGVLVYQGAVVDGQKIKFAETTKAYGCGVKY